MKKQTSERRFLHAERVFLHELASPLMLAEGWLERWEKRQPTIANEAEFQNLRTQVSKLRELLQTRRERLIEMEKDLP